ncbi:MAG TPA: hypothetical protein VGD50_03840 [Candidatus Baltobacteraceae bacterium]
MKPHVLFVPAVAAMALFMASVSAVQPAPTLTKWQQYQQSLYKRSAPADEYFGPQKLSYLGINNALRNTLAVAGDHTTDPGVIGAADRIEVALNAWEKKYPNDPQLARTYFLATNAYAKIWTQAYQQKAWQDFHELIARFPDSFFAKVMRRNLAIGFTEHYYAQPLICATPTPLPEPTLSSSPTPAPRGRHSEPTPSPSPTPSPTPTDSPTPSPTPTAAPGQPKIEILTPPCVAPATPTPSPTPPPVPPAPAISASMPTASSLPPATASASASTSATTAPTPIASAVATATPR